MRIRTTSISCKRSVKLSPNHSTETYPVSKTPFVFVVLVGEEGADPCSSPTEDGDCEGNLSFVTWMGELCIVDGPECNIKLDQLLFTKKLLLLLLVHDQAFLGQRISCPLMDSCLARETLQVSSERTHVVYCTSVFLIDQIAGNSSKSSKVPLCKSVYHSAKVFTESTVIRSSSILPRLIAMWKRRKSLMVASSGGGTPSLRRRGLVVWATSTVAPSSESTIPVSHFFFSIASTHLLDYISIAI